jgi:hypothetical protein
MVCFWGDGGFWNQRRRMEYAEGDGAILTLMAGVHVLIDLLCCGYRDIKKKKKTERGSGFTVHKTFYCRYEQ